MIAVVDVGTGNIRSVVRALEAASNRQGKLEIEITRDPAHIANADRIVMPGQGGFGDCAAALAANGGAIADAVRSAIRAGKPYLGICLGLQMLFESSEEAPGAIGLGVFAGTVQRFAPGLTDIKGARLKVPHVGWNQVEGQGEVSQWLGDRDWYYFVHSYFVVPNDPSLIAAKTQHGQMFVSAVRRDNVVAVQFHPEKSQKKGLALLQRWLAGAA